MSKIPPQVLDNSIKEILRYATEEKKRNFLETVELQIGLKNIDPSKDKRFAGSYRLPKETRPNMKVCLIADAKHLDIAKELGVEAVSLEDLKKFDKKKKLIKNWAKQYGALLATDSLIRTIPRIVGPQLNKMGMFPSPVSHSDNLLDKIAEARCLVKFQMKKVLCLGVAVGNVGLTDQELRVNISLSINFLVSLLKKGWQNVRSLYIKSSMGPAIRIY